MKQLLALMALMLGLMLIVSGVMAVGSVKQSEQMAQRTQQISSLKADVRRLKQERDELTSQLESSRALAQSLHNEQEALSGRLTGALSLLEGGVSMGAAAPAQPVFSMDAARLAVIRPALPTASNSDQSHLQGEPLLQLQALETALLRMALAQEAYNTRPEAEPDITLDADADGDADAAAPAEAAPGVSIFHVEPQGDASTVDTAGIWTDVEEPAGTLEEKDASLAKQDVPATETAAITPEPSPAALNAAYITEMPDSVPQKQTGGPASDPIPAQQALSVATAVAAQWLERIRTILRSTFGIFHKLPVN